MCLTVYVYSISFQNLWCWTPTASTSTTSAPRWLWWGRRAPPNQPSWTSSRYLTVEEGGQINSYWWYPVCFSRAIPWQNFFWKQSFLLHIYHTEEMMWRGLREEWGCTVQPWHYCHSDVALSSPGWPQSLWPAASPGEQQWQDDSLWADDETHPEVPSVHSATSGKGKHVTIFLCFKQPHFLFLGAVLMLTTRGRTFPMNYCAVFSMAQIQGPAGKELVYSDLFGFKNYIQILRWAICIRPLQSWGSNLMTKWSQWVANTDTSESCAGCFIQ